MKPSYALVALTAVVGLLVGAVLMNVLRPPVEPAPPSKLIDGRYLLVEGPDGHWIYEKGEKGLTVRAKELSPMGLAAIWGLQGKFVPASVNVGGETLVNIPATQYSTETGAFQVVHTFYRFVEDKLVEVKLEAAKRP